MRLHQCALAIFQFLFYGDLWPFGFSINITAPMQEDVPLSRFMLLRPTVFKKFYVEKNKMSSLALKCFFALALVCCATADFPCNSSVGIQNNELPDKSMTASSYYRGHFPYFGRLNNEIRKLKDAVTVWGAWCANVDNVNQYLQVDLGLVRNVSAIATQGYEYGNVKTYQIMYSVNGKQWSSYKENSTTKIFNGNDDKDSVVQHRLNRLLAARYIRFNPLTRIKVICMRVEIYACKIPATKRPTTLTTTNTENATKKDTVRTTTTTVSDVETTKKETEYQELRTPTSTNEGIIDGRNNAAGSLKPYSIAVFVTCIVLILNKFLY